ncbi:hypothetical protein Taro_015209 [Colocasia esculenta]|uniref:Uncharacterized protein n=1 Tax=Colocasia esculenta TaxID=4460 RepID=A0A843UH54_COLES|nr:hypothetical protein [Colocasia esculenta]
MRQVHGPRQERAPHGRRDNTTGRTDTPATLTARQKRVRSSPERNPYQDNNKRFWETSPEHSTTKRCTSASRAAQQQQETGTTQR